MTRLLVTIIDEVPTLNAEVVDTIIVQFLRVDPGTASQLDKKNKKHAPVDSKQDTLRLKEYPPAYNMAKAICGSCPEKMTNHISTYFNNVIVDASESFPHLNGSSKQSHKRPPSLDDTGEDTEDVQQLRKAHKLIRELWRACPDVLHNVVPQLEAELGADSVALRTIATETMGDVAAGIGVAGLPPIAQADPGAWPPMQVGQRESISTLSPLTTPMSPKPFSQTHTSAYDSFLSRCHDKSTSVRAAWVTAVGRILLTSGGGLGLDAEEEKKLVKGLAGMLSDAEERVRLAAVEVVGQFGFTDTINRLGRYGGVSQGGSLLAQLAERLKDKRHAVREAAFVVLGRKWGVAAFEIEQRNGAVTAALGDVPQHILSTFFTNDADIQLLLDKTIFECMVPLSFPPIKSTDSSKPATQRQRAVEAEDTQTPHNQLDPDQIRLRRLLTLYRDLDEKGRKVFQHLMQRQVKLTQVMTAYLKSCEEFNGGIVENGEAEIKARLTKIVELFSRTMPDSAEVSADLWKFAKINEKRNYQLIRFAMAAESDYRTVVKAIKELTKRIQTSPTGSASLLETLTPLLYRCSLLFLNRSHIPAVIEISRNDESGLGLAAHELLKMISSLCPAVLKTQILDMCKDLEANAPTASKPENPGDEDTLKACAGFARKFPEEIPKDRKFQVAMTHYALYSSSPRAAKHAVTIIMQTAEKKEYYSKDLIAKAVKAFSPDSTHVLACLATIAQISLLAPTAADAESDAITHIALNQVLLHEAPASDSSDRQYAWSDEIPTSVSLKEWALKVLVNRLRALPDDGGDVVQSTSAIRQVAEPIYRILNLLISNEGELHKSNSTPGAERPRLRLIAVKLLLKLCSHRRACEELVTPESFNAIALVGQDRTPPVRKGFVDHLKRYLTANRLSARWYTVLFVYAFEPDATLRVGTSLWLKNQSQQIVRSARAATSADGKSHYQNVVELLFARLLSLLAHHVDYPSEGESENYAADLLDFTRYILFYLTSVSNEENLSLIFHIAQRVKQTRDGIAATLELEDIFSERLYTLSDLAQAVIRSYADILSTTKGHEKGVNLLQTWPGKLRLPASIFKAFEPHQRELAHTIAEKDFLADMPKLKEDIEGFVRNYMKPTTAAGKSASQRKKRKTEDVQELDDEDDGEKAGKKKHKSSAARLPIRKASHSAPVTKKKRKSDEDRGTEPEQPSRKSSRKSGATVNYADRDSEDDDMEMGEDGAKSNQAKAQSKSVGRSSSVTAETDDEAEDDLGDAMDVEDNENTTAEKTPKSSSSKRQPRSSASKPNGTVHSSTPASSSASKPKPKSSSTSKPASKSKSRSTRHATEDDEDDVEEDAVQDSKAAMSAIAKKHQSKLKTGSSSSATAAGISSPLSSKEKGKEDEAAATAEQLQEEGESGGGETRRGPRILRRQRRRG